MVRSINMRTPRPLLLSLDAEDSIKEAPYFHSENKEPLISHY